MTPQENAGIAPLTTPLTGPDGRSGWRWVELLSPEAIDSESDILRLHDRASSGYVSYSKEMAAYERSVFSLRDPDNQPHLVMETWEGRMLQIKSALGHARTKTYNSPNCPPQFFELVGALATPFATLCEARGWTPGTSSEVERAGVVGVPGLGLCSKGQAPSESALASFKAALAGPDASALANKALPALAVLGWMDEVEAILPLTDSASQSKALSRAAGAGSLPAVERLLEVAGPAFNGSEALREAAGQGQLAVVERLLPLSDPTASTPSSGSALSLAAFNGHAPVVERLLSATNSWDGASASLQSAASLGHLEVVKLLLPIADPTAQHSEALHSATRRGFEDVAQVIQAAIDQRVVDKLATRRAQAQPTSPTPQAFKPAS